MGGDCMAGPSWVISAHGWSAIYIWSSGRVHSLKKRCTSGFGAGRNIVVGTWCKAIGAHKFSPLRRPSEHRRLGVHGLPGARNVTLRLGKHYTSSAGD